MDQARLEKLAEMKLQLEAERQRVKDSGGVVYKGSVPACPSYKICG